MKKSLFKAAILSFLASVMLLATTFTLPCLPVQAAESQPECWGVFIGVSDYQNFSYSWYGDDDARDLSDELSPTWGSNHVQLLTNSQATRSAILSAIDWLASKAGTDDTVLFFFSGASSPITEYLYTYDSLITSLSNDISFSELASAFQSVQAGKIVFIFNCFISDNMRNDLIGNGRLILTCSSPGESWWEARALGHSVFVYYLIQAFNKFDTVDTNHDYELSIEEIFQYAGPQTSEYETDNNLSTIQHPVMDDRYSGNLALLAKFVFTIGTPLPSGTNILTLDGVNYTSAPSARLWVPGVSHTMTVPQTVSVGSDTRYVFTGWNDGNTSTTRSITKGSYSTSYDKEYLLQLTSEYGGTFNGTGWYKEGEIASISVIPNIELPDTKHIFTNWSGDYAGTSSSTSLVMDEPKVITANWRHEYLLTLNSVYGTLTGAGWYQEGETASFSVTPKIELPDTKHIFTSWSGDYSGTSSSASLVIDAPKVVTANWRHEYLLTINSVYGKPTGDGWYKEGETASVSVQPIQGAIIRQIFTGWSGDLTNKDADSSVLINSPKTVTANWRTDYIQLYILIGGVAVLGAAIATTIILLRRRASARLIVPSTPVIESATPTTPAPPPVVTPPSTPPSTAAATPMPPPAPPVTPAQAPSAPTAHIAQGTLTLPDKSEIQLNEPIKYIGRDDFSKIATPDTLKYISRPHCMIIVEAGKYFIEDLQSANGTRVNGVNIAGKGKQELKGGDKIDIADVMTLIFRVVN